MELQDGQHLSTVASGYESSASLLPIMHCAATTITTTFILYSIDLRNMRTVQAHDLHGSWLKDRFPFIEHASCASVRVISQYAVFLKKRVIYFHECGLAPPSIVRYLLDEGLVASHQGVVR